MTAEQRKQFHEGTQRMKACLLDVFIAIQDEAQPVTIKARLDQSNAATRDFVKLLNGFNKMH